jgi:hypothetical protein
VRRRLVLSGVLMSALLVPGSALAGLRSFQGPVSPRGAVAFTAKFRDGKPRAIPGSTERPGFSWSGVPAGCDAGPTDVDGHFSFPMRVRYGQFHGKGVAKDPGTGKVVGLARVRGEFRNHGQDAVGTIRISGEVPGYGTGCETGRDDWSATRQ